MAYDSGEILRLEGKDVNVPRMVGPAETFQWPSFVLQKPRWVADEEVRCCFICKENFTQLRRKHHCRQCGRIACKNCCKDKIYLPQLALEKDEKVCTVCFPVADLVAKSRSSHINHRIDAAKQLAEFCEDPHMVLKVIELGGIQALVALASVEQKEVQKAVMKGLHVLSMHLPLHNLLTQSGAVKAISHILEKSNSEDKSIMSNGINTLHLLCKSPELRTKVLQDGALIPVLNLCQMDDTIALIAMMTLCIIAEDEQTHSIIVDSQRVQALPRILCLSTSTEPQMQLVALKTLAYISTGNNWHRHQVIQKDYASGENLKIVLQSNLGNPEILGIAVCLVANLAVSLTDKNRLSELQKCLCSLLDANLFNDSILYNVMRGIANFSKFKLNAPTLMQYFPQIISKGVQSKKEKIRDQGLRVTTFLLAYMPEQTMGHLLSNGVTDFLKGLTSFENFFETMDSFLSEKCQEVELPSEHPDFNMK